MQALRAEPRRETGYSNLGYIVLGAVIEAVTNRPWRALLADEVMIPLGIARFGLGAPKRRAEQPHQPVGHRRIDGAWQARLSDNPAAYGPAGRVHLALDEWGRFLRAHLPGHDLLSPAVQATLHRPNDSGAAMGWFTRGEGGTRRLVHTGSNTAWFAQATLDPRHSIALGIVCNAWDARVEDAVGVLSDQLLSSH